MIEMTQLSSFMNAFQLNALYKACDGDHWDNLLFFSTLS